MQLDYLYEHILYKHHALWSILLLAIKIYDLIDVGLAIKNLLNALVLYLSAIR